MRRSTILAVLAVVALGCSSTTTTNDDESAGLAPAPTTPSVTTVPLGESMQLTRELFNNRTVATITVADLKTNVKPNNAYVKPQRGQFLAVTVTVQVTEGRIALNQGSFKFVAADGVVYSTTLPVAKPELGWTDVAQGQKTHGAVTFDVPAAAEKGARIALTEWFAKGDAGYWTV
jgi:hypothetical protein